MESIIDHIENFSVREKETKDELLDARKVVSRKIRQWRIDRDLSLTGFAKMLNISPAYLSDIESGSRGFSDALIKKLKSIKIDEK